MKEVIIKVKLYFICFQKLKIINNMTSRQKRIIFITLGIIIGVILISILFNNHQKNVSLTMWGFYDSPDTINYIISSFNQKYPNIKIQYIQKTPDTYYNDLIIAFANNKAPDIFMLPGNWIPTFQNKIQPLDLNKDKDINLKFIENNYPKIVKNDLVLNNNLFGVPISLDTLALYYNKDIFYKEGIPLPPKNWNELLNLIPRLRKIDNQGNILRAAIALGTYDNIQWANDILASLMMQYGSSITDINTKQATFGNEINFNGKTIIPGISALQSYTQFADPKSQYYTWTNEFFNNIYAFSQNKVAMIISYHLIQKDLEGKVNFGITNFPLIDPNNSQYYGRTINLAVSNRSKYSKEAWLFLKLWTNPKIEDYYFKQTNNLPALTSLIQQLYNDADLWAFATQLPYCNSYYQFNYKIMNETFSKMINDIIAAHLDYDEVIKDAVNRINLAWQNKQ